jgi:outer membrane lipoprotein-sorting protein
MKELKNEKMKRLSILLCCILALGFDYPDGDLILQKVDQNMSSKNRVFESSMTIHGKRNSRTIISRTLSEGTKKSFTEYLSPASDKGTKMLKLQGQLWIYSPSTDRIIQISGNMLRQSVMGSDLSYEDMMDDRKLTETYSAKVAGEEKIGDRKTVIIELTAKVENVAYHKQRMWIDLERYVPLKEELYAKSGQLLKKVEFKEVQKIQGRWFPTTVIYKDVFKDGNGTEFNMTSLKFNQEIPEYIFSKAALKQ